MKYRSVGRSGLKVSQVALGSWMTDLRGSEAARVAEETIRLAYDRGVNFFDCADAYSGGEAEKFLGRCLKGIRRSTSMQRVRCCTRQGLSDTLIRLQ